MKNTKNRIILVAEIVFVAALLWGSAQIIKAQNWQAPSQAFPSANVEAPLDVSPNPQIKTGSLTLQRTTPYAVSLGIGYKNAIGGIAFNSTSTSTSTSTSLIPVFYPFTSIAGIDNQTQILNGSGALYVNTKGLVLPDNMGTSGLNGTKGMIIYDLSSDTVKLYNGKWVDIGTGTGTGTGGTEYWKANGSTGIHYQGDNVTIDNSLPSYQSGFYYLKTVSLGDIKNSFAFINQASASNPPAGTIGKMGNCDTTVIGLECTKDFYSQQEEPGEQDQIRYDQYLVITCPEDPSQAYYVLDGEECNLYSNNGTYQSSISATKTTYYKEFIYETRQVSSGTNSATLFVGSIDVGSINIKPTITGNINPIGNTGWFISTRGSMNYSCEDKNRGEMRFLEGKDGKNDMLCVCKYTSERGNQWVCW